MLQYHQPDMAAPSPDDPPMAIGGAKGVRWGTGMLAIGPCRPHWMAPVGLFLPPSGPPVMANYRLSPYRPTSFRLVGNGSTNGTELGYCREVRYGVLPPWYCRTLVPVSTRTIRLSSVFFAEPPPPRPCHVRMSRMHAPDKPFFLQSGARAHQDAPGDRCAPANHLATS